MQGEAHLLHGLERGDWPACHAQLLAHPHLLLLVGRRLVSGHGRRRSLVPMTDDHRRLSLVLVIDHGRWLGTGRVQPNLQSGLGLGLGLGLGYIATSGNGAATYGGWL